MNPIPYGFESIDTQHTVLDAPLWRDGHNTESRLGGEILVTLEALTPLIVGNHQQKIDDKHSLLEPQMLKDRRVLLGATSLKGMLRSALASLLQAPMERVAEHHYTYRPNLGFGPKNDPKVEMRAAIVSDIQGEGADATVKVRLLPKDCAVVFVRDEAYAKLGEPQPGEHIHRKCQDVALTGTAPRMRLDSKCSNDEQLDHRVFLYRGGIDGQGHLATAFSPNSKVYQKVLVHDQDYAKTQRVSIAGKVLKAYYQTQTILADDSDGHLSPGHPLLSKGLDQSITKKAIKANTGLQTNQLIYVEIKHGLTQSGKPGLRINSMGHHFQYRWGYASSVRRRNRLIDGVGEIRPELAPHPDERSNADGAPQQLSGARLLFGYAVDERDGEQKDLAKEHFKRLAGRIAFNTAIEDPASKSMQERFMQGGDEIQLRILGMPRPSAVEFYLKQTALPKKLTTYGDLHSDPGGDLAGRKFYRHQPDARKKSGLYAPSQHERQGDTNTDERGNRVRFLSSPGSRFLTTLRFDSLRPWELGALLLALNPALAESCFGLTRHSHGYAHKLGYGKPLGLGSVKLTLDAARWQENDRWQWQQAGCGDDAWKTLEQTCLAALKNKLQSTWGDKTKEHVTTWLKARRWSDRGSASYPTRTIKNESTIFNYHTTLRKDHAAARRGDDRKNFADLKRLLETGQ